MINKIGFRQTEYEIREPNKISLIQHFEADVSLKILNSGIILKSFTHVISGRSCVGLFESYLVINPEDRFSPDEAHRRPVHVIHSMHES